MTFKWRYSIAIILICNSGRWRCQKFGMGDSKMFMMFLYSLLFFYFSSFTFALSWGGGNSASGRGFSSIPFALSPRGLSFWAGTRRYVSLVFVFMVFNMYRYYSLFTKAGGGVHHLQWEGGSPIHFLHFYG